MNRGEAKPLIKTEKHKLDWMQQKSGFEYVCPEHRNLRSGVDVQAFSWKSVKANKSGLIAN